MKIAGCGSITVSRRYVRPIPEAVEGAFRPFETLNAQAGQLPAREQEFSTATRFSGRYVDFGIARKRLMGL
jgi:hypothetical protein